MAFFLSIFLYEVEFIIKYFQIEREIKFFSSWKATTIIIKQYIKNVQYI